MNEIAEALDLKQPQVSKHLRVLLAVDLVAVRQVGQQRRYRLKGEALKPVHEWVATFEQHWNERFDRLEQYLSQLQAKENADDSDQ